MKIKDKINKIKSIFGIEVLIKNEDAVNVLLNLSEKEITCFWKKVFKIAETFKEERKNGVSKTCYRFEVVYFNLQIFCKFKRRIFKKIIIEEFAELTEDEFIDKKIEYKNLKLK